MTPEEIMLGLKLSKPAPIDVTFPFDPSVYGVSDINDARLASIAAMIRGSTVPTAKELADTQSENEKKEINRRMRETFKNALKTGAKEARLEDLRDKLVFDLTKKLEDSQREEVGLNPPEAFEYMGQVYVKALPACRVTSQGQIRLDTVAQLGMAFLRDEEMLSLINWTRKVEQNLCETLTLEFRLSSDYRKSEALGQALSSPMPTNMEVIKLTEPPAKKELFPTIKEIIATPTEII